MAATLSDADREALAASDTPTLNTVPVGAM